ncbi:MAG: acetoacetate decarboxylase family protein [Steroidobacteraceae bacterium]|nr:acetoacetate decarboxylase family protein [Steroidobacteraceae bacterium]
MLQPDASLPEVPLVPAPWDLRGVGWIVALKLPPRHPAHDAFLPDELRGRGRALASFLVFADYAESGCGPYREILFIPGAFPFDDGRRYLSISRILVSTWDSVVNGRNNWGIPKDRADFEVQRDGREESIRVTSEGREVCDLRFTTLRFAPPLPVRSGIVPAALRTLAQRFRGNSYYYAPAARGRVRPGRLQSWRFDPELFPDLAGSAVVATLRVDSFRLTFPPARVQPPCMRLRSSAPASL